MRPRDLTTPPLTIKQVERFARKFKIFDDGCWVWQATLYKGYGQFWAGGRPSQAHRVAYRLGGGDLSELQLDHLCRNRACVNPQHLEPVSGWENKRRGRSWVHILERTHCPQGHEYSQENTYFRSDRNCRECKTCNKLRIRNWRRRNATATIKNN